MMISRDEWLQALNDAGLTESHDPDALTVSEFAAMMGLTHSSARRRLLYLVSHGSAMETRRRSAPGRAAVKAYRLIQQPAKKGRKH